MELQWPLILFTSFLAASAGLFCMQGVYACIGKAPKSQASATVISFILLVVGGIAVFFHLQHWERIFNGFGHITSGITQELIAIVVLAVLMVLFFAMARREIPKWLGALAIIGSIALVLVMGHSYMMPSRPAWDSVWQPLSLLGAAAGTGAGLLASISSKEDEADEDGLAGKLAVGGTTLNLALTAIYVAVMATAGGSFPSLGNLFDPTMPTASVVSTAALNPFAPASAAFTVGAIVLAAAALVFAVIGYRVKKWSWLGWVIAACSFASAILLRMVFYSAGGSVFLFY